MYFKCNKILRLTDQYKLHVSNYIFQLLHFSIDEEIEANLHVNHQINNHNTRCNNQISISRVNRSQTCTPCPIQWCESMELLTGCIINANNQRDFYVKILVYS